MAVAQDAADVSGALTGTDSAQTGRAECPETGDTREELRDTRPGDGASVKTEHESKSGESAFHATPLESTPADRSLRTEEEAGGTQPPKDDLGAASGDAATDATKTTTGGSDATKTTIGGSAASDATKTTTGGSAASDGTKTTTGGSAASDATKTTTGGSAGTDATKTTTGASAATDANKTTTGGSAATDATKTTTGGSAGTDATKTTIGASAATDANKTTTGGSAATDATKTTAGSAATKTTVGSAASDATKTTTGGGAATETTKTTAGSAATETTAVSAATETTKTTASSAANIATKTTTGGSAATETTAVSAATDATKTIAGNTSVKTTKMTLSKPPEPTKTALDKELEALLSLGPADPPPHDVLMIQSEQNGTMDIVKADPSLEKPTVTEGKGPPPPLRPASTWTSANLREFKHRMASEKHGLLTIRRGEVLTVRVPTHPDGKRLCWEFATDDYDIGFGIYFDWTPVTSTAVTLQVSESSDEEEEEDAESPWHSREGDVERGSVYRLRSRYGEIMQVYRRDSHREVQAGSHEYPGEGVYLLKLDNSYSLLRNKTLYFHVYYSS